LSLALAVPYLGRTGAAGGWEVGSGSSLPRAVKQQEAEDFFSRDPIKHRETLHRAVRVFTSLVLKLHSYERKLFKINNNLSHLWH